MNGKKRAYINGFRSVSCAGSDNEELFRNICEKRTGITVNESYFPGIKAGLGIIKSSLQFEDILRDECSRMISEYSIRPEETVLIVGASVGGIHLTERIFFKEKSYKNITPDRHNIHSVASLIQEKYKFANDFSFSTACTSSANALSLAAELISKGFYSSALCLGADSLSFTTVGGFASLGVLSPVPCRPFDINRTGMNVAEGIAMLLVQDVKTERSIEICGVGCSSDAFQITMPDPNGAKSAMLNALQSAGISPDSIHYINTHGTGTMANDSSELSAVKEIFGSGPYVSSTKSVTGHTLGAAGALEAVISCMAIQKKTVPPNAGLEDPEIDGIRYSTEPVKENIKYILSNSFAFGGNNVSIVFGDCNEN